MEKIKKYESLNLKSHTIALKSLGTINPFKANVFIIT